MPDRRGVASCRIERMACSHGGRARRSPKDGASQVLDAASGPSPLGTSTDAATREHTTPFEIPRAMGDRLGDRSLPRRPVCSGAAAAASADVRGSRRTRADEVAGRTGAAHGTRTGAGHVTRRTRLAGDAPARADRRRAGGVGAAVEAARVAAGSFAGAHVRAAERAAASVDAAARFAEPAGIAGRAAATPAGACEWVRGAARTCRQRREQEEERKDT